MSSFDRRMVLRGTAALGLSGFLAGCFRPMLAENAPARGLRGRIALPAVESRFDHYLRESLEDRLGTPTDPAWRLDVETRLTEDDLAITPDGVITRKNLTARADYRLSPIVGGAAVLADEVVSQSGYNATASLYATRVAAQEVEERLAADLGLRIAHRVLAAAGRLERS